MCCVYTESGMKNEIYRTGGKWPKEQSFDGDLDHRLDLGFLQDTGNFKSLL